MIVVVDYGMGNVGSILNMLRRVGAQTMLTCDPRALARAAGVVLPGVGSFDTARKGLDDRDLVGPLLETASAGTPLLGICLGMQLLTAGSEEGVRPGLGLLKTIVKKFPAEHGQRPLRVPHMGWTQVCQTSPPGPVGSLAHALFDGMAGQPRYYFAHSYYGEVDGDECIATAEHGLTFAAALGVGCVAGTQFHPEKSHRFGLSLMSTFTAHCEMRVRDHGSYHSLPAAQ